MVAIREIAVEDTDRVCAFLHTHLNRRVPVAAWQALVQPPWAAIGPNRGFQLVDDDGHIVGVYVAVYSTREWHPFTVCNLAAFCVLETHRQHSVRLVRALTRQKDCVFTDLSPSGTVPAMNARLGFAELDTTTRLLLNLPRVPRGISAIDDAEALAGILEGNDAVVYRDHREAPASQHVAVVRGGEYAYLMYRRDRRKRLPLFATPIYAGGSRDLLNATWGAFGAHFLGRGMSFTLAEQRVLGCRPTGPGRDLARPRTKMHKGQDSAAVDYLYSELALLEW